jgi:hypothetical protein
MIVHILILNAFEVCTKCKAFHSAEEVWMIGQHIFKRTVPFASLPHKNSPCFLNNLGLHDSGAFSKILDPTLVPDNRIYCFPIAFRA